MTPSIRLLDSVLWMIAAWRRAFAREDLGFVIIQLPRFRDPLWPLIRDGQRACAEADAHAALVVTIDTGEDDNAHPLDKAPIGARAADAAMKNLC